MTGEWLWAVYVSISRTDPFINPFMRKFEVDHLLSRDIFDVMNLGAQARGMLDSFTLFSETPSVAASHLKSAAFDLLVNS